MLCMLCFVFFSVDIPVSCALESAPKTTPTPPHVIALKSISQCKHNCACGNKLHCHPRYSLEQIDYITNRTAHIVMMAKESESYLHWKWNHITAVISAGEYRDMHVENFDLMCYAHSLGKRYGYIAKVTNDGGEFASQPELEKYLLPTLNNLYCSYNSIFVFDFIPLFMNPGKNFTLKIFDYFLQTTKFTLSQKLKNDRGGVHIYCIVPWQPCLLPNVSCTHLAASLKAFCEYLVIGPRSFMFNHKCRALPEVPLIKMVYGVELYVSHGIRPENIVLGVAWHGHDYLCDSVDIKIGTCMVKKDPTPPHSCDINFSKGYVSLGKMTHNRYPNMFSTSRWSFTNECPFFFYNDTKNQTHQVWFENWESLYRKYIFVRDFNLGGVSIWYGDDITLEPTNAPEYHHTSMWNYLLTSLYFPSKRSLPHSVDYTGKVAGAAIGSLLLGTVLGFLFMYIACIRPRKFSLRPPFRKDAEQFVDEPDSKLTHSCINLYI